MTEFNRCSIPAAIAAGLGMFMGATPMASVALFVLTLLHMGMPRSVPQLILGFVVMGLCVSVHCQSSHKKMLSQWFDRHRGLAMGIAITFGSGMGAFTPPRVADSCSADCGARS